MSDNDIIPSLLKDVDLQLIDDLKRVPDNEKITIPRITKYEKTEILGCLAQIAAKTMTTNESPKVVAEKMYSEGLVPYIIKRPLPNGKYELWKFGELMKS